MECAGFGTRTTAITTRVC